jgi:hypothetical protein
MDYSVGLFQVGEDGQVGKIQHWPIRGWITNASRDRLGRIQPMVGTAKPLPQSQNGQRIAQAKTSYVPRTAQ